MQFVKQSKKRIYIKINIFYYIFDNTLIKILRQSDSHGEDGSEGIAFLFFIRAYLL